MPSRRAAETALPRFLRGSSVPTARRYSRSEEHTSELQSQSNLVCRLLLEKKTQANTVYVADNDACAIRTFPLSMDGTLWHTDRDTLRLNSGHPVITYADSCLTRRNKHNL